MKKRVLTLLLAVLMVCALLPFGALAADLSPYQQLIKDQAYTDDKGVLRDLDGDGTEELLMFVDDGQFRAKLYTISGGQAKLLMNLPLYYEDSGISDLDLVHSGNKTSVATTVETNTPADPFDGKSMIWNEGSVTLYQLSGGTLKKIDQMDYRLYMEADSNRFYPDYSYITRNGKEISADEMNALFDYVVDNALEYYPMQQVYDAVQGFFQAVAMDQYYAVPIGWALDKGITNGTSNVDFSPMASCTRGQVVTFLWRAAGKPAPKSSSNPFSDVKKGDYYYDAVLWAVEKGITNGTSATTFSPNQNCTRGQVVTFLWRNAGSPKTSGSNPFGDVKSGEYYYSAVLWAVGHNPQITNGTSATTFSPSNTCTRGQIVTFLYRYVEG